MATANFEKACSNSERAGCRGKHPLTGKVGARREISETLKEGGTAEEEGTKGGQNYCPFPGCDKRFVSQNNLKTHLRIHTDDRPYVCNYDTGGILCDKSFSTSYALKTHIRTHTNERPYVCTYIQADSSSRVAIMDEEGQITVGGVVCGKSFKTCGDLRKHVRTHTGLRPFTCDYPGCEMMFTTSNILKVHKRTHSGERPYRCQAAGCSKTFASSTNYKNHLRIHSGDKPYVCSVEGCGKGFTEYSSLYKHHVVHTKDRPYPCTLCGKLYRQTSTLAMHRRMAHNITESHAHNSACGRVTVDGRESAVSYNSCQLIDGRSQQLCWEGQQLQQQAEQQQQEQLVNESDQQPFIGVLVTTADGLGDMNSAAGQKVLLQLSDCSGLMYDEVDNQLVIDTDIFQQQQHPQEQYQQHPQEQQQHPQDVAMERVDNSTEVSGIAKSSSVENGSLQRLRIVTDSKGNILNIS